jgi:xylan 1,4-beta-xylosidase
VYLRVALHEERGIGLNIIQSKHGVYNELLDQDVPLAGLSRFRLKAVLDREFAQFYYMPAEEEWAPVGERVDITHLCDEDPEYIRFTGTFIGLCAQDLGGTRKHADFDYFAYREQE